LNLALLLRLYLANDALDLKFADERFSDHHFFLNILNIILDFPIKKLLRIYQRWLRPAGKFFQQTNISDRATRNRPERRV
jgi:hypothetical protein